MWTAIAVVVLGWVLVILFTPVEVTLRCERRPESAFRCRFGFRLPFGLVSREMASAGAPRAAAEMPEPASRKRRRRKPRRPRYVMAMLRTRGFPTGAVRLLLRLGHALRVRDLYVWLRAGFEDPADTGLLCSWLMPARACLELRQPGRWDVAPVFATPSPILDLAIRARVRLMLARLLWPFVVFGLSPSTVRGFIALGTGRAL